MEKEKKSKKQEFKELYGFNSGGLKWIPEGGELLKYIGQTVVFVNFEKKDGEWTSTTDQAVIKGINNFDPITMTYDITYYICSDVAKNEITEKIIPEGFTFDIMGQGLQTSMHRFVPVGLHCDVIAEELYYKRVGDLFDNNRTMAYNDIKAISEDKNNNTLKYARNIVAAVRPTKETEKENELEYTDDLYIFRITELRLRFEGKTGRRIMMYDDKKRLYTVAFDETEDPEYYELYQGSEYIGDLKILDLMGNVEDSH